MCISTKTRTVQCTVRSSFESQFVCAVTSIEPRYIDIVKATDFRVLQQFLFSELHKLIQ